MPLALGDAFHNIVQIKALLREHGFESSGHSMLDTRKEAAEFYFSGNKTGIKALEKLCTVLTSSGITVTAHSCTKGSMSVTVDIGEHSRLFRDAQMEGDGFSHNEKCSRSDENSLVLCESLSRLCTGVWKDSVYEVKRYEDKKIRAIYLASSYTHTMPMKYCPFCGQELNPKEE